MPGFTYQEHKSSSVRNRSHHWGIIMFVYQKVLGGKKGGGDTKQQEQNPKQTPVNKIRKGK